ncbi:recombinase family protein [Curtobacterium flaccumfaciens pv. oortii]|uniref:recombinase family protein n=1 Tax=Curtobacterium flaccumfaciens TaxID=2035 RepID=UPI001BDF5628|nr:recombinase family protein [Curtobacterium flaccumfaciens]MBT1621525.1 recombinase family protein [Curtobacterium flaccumfaciens pv. oortii]
MEERQTAGSAQKGLPAAIYARISRDKAGAGLGVDRQEADCRALAERLGWDVVAVFVDNDISAYDRRKVRPEYRAMLDAARSREIRGVIAWHTDRLYRRTTDLEELVAVVEANDLQVQTVRAGNVDLATPSGRMFARTLGNMAQYEVEQGRDRVKSAKNQAAADGKYRGGIRPFGFEKDGVTVRESEAQVIRDATKAVLAGRTLAALTRELNERGVQTSGRSETWKYGALRDMLIRPRNAGLLARGLPGKKGQSYEFEVLGPASWPAIVSEDEWRALVALVTDPSRRLTPSNETKWLGSGIYRCGVPVVDDNGQERPCGGTLRATPHGGTYARQYERRYLYRCTESAHLTVGQKQTDEYVIGRVLRRLANPEALAGLTVDDPQLTIDREKRSTLSARLEAFEADYALGNITGPQLAKATTTVEAELAKVDARLAKGLSRSASSSVLRAPDPGHAFLEAAIDVQRALLVSLLRVEVLPAVARGSKWSPERLRITPVN